MALCAKVFQWHHHYLEHSGISRLKATISTVVYWLDSFTNVKRVVKSCKQCQTGKRHNLRYTKIPPKTSDQVPCHNGCVNLISPYTLKGQGEKTMVFMCLTITDPATGWFEMVDLLVISQMVEKGYTLTQKGIKPQNQRISAILALSPPSNVKQ